jgi:hypothetical protein
MHICQNAN